MEQDLRRHTRDTFNISGHTVERKAAAKTTGGWYQMTGCVGKSATIPTNRSRFGGGGSFLFSLSFVFIIFYCSTFIPYIPFHWIPPPLRSSCGKVA